MKRQLSLIKQIMENRLTRKLALLNKEGSIMNNIVRELNLDESLNELEKASIMYGPCVRKKKILDDLTKKKKKMIFKELSIVYLKI